MRGGWGNKPSRHYRAIDPLLSTKPGHGLYRVRGIVARSEGSYLKWSLLYTILDKLRTSLPMLLWHRVTSTDPETHSPSKVPAWACTRGRAKMEPALSALGRGESCCFPELIHRRPAPLGFYFHRKGKSSSFCF